MLTGRAPAYEGVRIGLGLYGLLPLDLPMPDDELALAAKLKPAMALKAGRCVSSSFRPAYAVSYGGRWTTARDSVIATPAGRLCRLQFRAQRRGAKPSSVAVACRW